MKTNCLKVSFFFTAVLLVSSCNKKIEVNADFEIINNTSSTIDSLYIKPNKQIKFISVKSKELKTYKTDMSDIARVDGNYLLKYKLEGKDKIKHFGYYSNGIPMEKITVIKIDVDTIIFDFKH